MLLKTSILSLLLVSFGGLVVSQECKGQSCAIAALSGSTKESFDEIVKGAGGKNPQGSNSQGKSCITKYYKQLGLKAPAAVSRGTERFAKAPGRDIFGFDTETLLLDSEKSQASEKALPIENSAMAMDKLDKRQGGCKPNALLFARGTTEIGSMGSTVGPALSSALSLQGGGNWHVEGIRYNADIAGDNCIGFPGGIKCVDQLAALAAKCPNTNFFISGYSQGAMVARICAAYSKDNIKEKIKGVVVFGDPFNGASIKGFPQENIKTFCAAGDGVCSGKFLITGAHLSYTAGSSVSSAAKWMIGKAHK